MRKKTEVKIAMPNLNMFFSLQRAGNGGKTQGNDSKRSSVEYEERYTWV